MRGGFNGLDSYQRVLTGRLGPMLSSPGALNKEAFPTQACQALRRHLGIATLLQMSAGWSDTGASYTAGFLQSAGLLTVCRQATPPGIGRLREKLPGVETKAGVLLVLKIYHHVDPIVSRGPGRAWSWAPAILGLEWRKQGMPDSARLTPQICAHCGTNIIRSPRC